MLLISCTSTHKNENPKINWPCFPDPILDDNSRVYQIPNSNDVKKFIYEEDGYIILPKEIWEQYYKWENEVIIPDWYWISLGSFVIDYEAAIERLKIMEEVK